MSRIRLDPLDVVDMSAGLNKSRTSPSLLGAGEMSESENVRHLGRGKLIRREGMKRFASAGVTPIQPDADEKAGRFIYPYLRRINQTVNKRTIVEVAAVIKNALYRCVDGFSPIAIRLKDAGAINSFITWKPYSTDDTSRQFEDYGNCGAGFLDKRVYLGTTRDYQDFTDPGGDPVRALNYPYGVLVRVADITGFVVGNTLTGATSGATSVIRYINTTQKTMFCSGWDGVPYESGETVADGAGSDTVTKAAEYALSGVILDHDNDPTTNFEARKWGIEKPFAAITGAEGAAGSIEAGTYAVKYTFLRYEGGSMSAGDNPMLSGGSLISESAPSPSVDITIVANKKINFTAWEVSPDPQATHIRIYRTDGTTTVYRHDLDIAIGTGSGSINSNYDVTTSQLQSEILTDDYKVFGEDGENSGDIIESAVSRMLVAGNPNYPNRMYMGRSLIEQRHHDYFYTSLDIGETPGESITAIKWWKSVIWIFTERSTYRVIEVSLGTLQSTLDNGDIATQQAKAEGHELVTRGSGCATRGGVLDMGNHLLVLTEDGARRFSGSEFDKEPLTEGVRDILGTNLLNAVMTKDDDYVYIISETSRALGLIITMKHRDGSYALGTDTINSNITLPERMDFVPPLTNFANTLDDSDYMIGLFLNPSDAGAVKYWIGKYNLAGQNKDLLFTTAADVQYAIEAKFSPRVFDFGSFAETTLEEVIAYIISCGDDVGDLKAPTGKFLVKVYLDQGPDGTAKRYTELQLKPKIKRNKAMATRGGIEPLQNKYSKPFDATYQHQTGGVYSRGGNPAGLFADVHEIFYRAGESTTISGRMWKFLFVYNDAANFEFSSAGFKFIYEQENL